ncbi:hypothetical protein [Methylomarinum vadi]|uniref:hypothetical protein n=1 Tax=Methylomarinum vadi TaxID=438855 RepID=UPI0004DFAE2A|nr:hypothetical protein [Methylomarinum vadi]
MSNYQIIMHGRAYQRASDYLGALQSRATKPGQYLKQQLQSEDMNQLSIDRLLECLLNSKRPQIFAESAVHGGGEDWNRDELKLLGDIGVAVPVTVYDNGKHHAPEVHATPFSAHLLFSAGALLRNGKGQTPVDWDVVGKDGEIDRERYYQLYLCRLLPLLLYADAVAGAAGHKALVTVPGLGCGQFAGRFIGALGDVLKATLQRLLTEHGGRLSNIRVVYFDPYNECQNQRIEIGHIVFMVRPLTQGNQDKPQLCRPEIYQESGDDFREFMLFSIVAWDHVSWPGNDFYAGSRATDDGVKAAATDSMKAMTGVTGKYNAERTVYEPPKPYRNWEQVVLDNGLKFELAGRFNVLS